MNYVGSLSEKLSWKMRENDSSMDDEKQEIIQYGLYVLLGDIGKMAITFTLAYFLGILSFVLLSIVSVGLLRTFCGGVHSKTWFGCLISNTTINFSIVYLSIFMADINKYLLASVIGIITLLVMYKYAPSDHENKPVVGIKHRKKLRIITFSIILLQITVSIIIPIPIISNILLIALFSNVISILPITYTLTDNRHGDAYFEKP